MPTESDYRAAAATAAAHAATLTTIALCYPNYLDAPGVRGGTAGDHVRSLLTDAEERNRHSIAQLIELNAEFERRAQSCAEFTAALNTWRREVDRWEERKAQLEVSGGLVPGYFVVGPYPTQPAPPFPEAEEG